MNRRTKYHCYSPEVDEKLDIESSCSPRYAAVEYAERIDSIDWNEGSWISVFVRAEGEIHKFKVIKRVRVEFEAKDER